MEFWPLTTGVSWIWRFGRCRYMAGYGYGAVRIHVVYTSKEMMVMMSLSVRNGADYIYAMIAFTEVQHNEKLFLPIFLNGSLVTPAIRIIPMSH